MLIPPVCYHPAMLDPEQLVVKANELDETMGFIFWLTETAVRVFPRFSTGNSPAFPLDKD